MAYEFLDRLSEYTSLQETMRDPIPAPAFLVKAATPYAQQWGLTTLPPHVHEIILGFVWYHAILYIISPALSRLLVPKAYAGFNKRTRLNWDIHWVSMIQALFINSAALYVIWNDPQTKTMDWRSRLWGYTPASGMVQGFAAGYFLWDLQISSVYLNLAGPSALLHAIGALAVTMIGYRPFGNYYGLSFVLYELSTPFLNIHWFCDKLGMTGSRLQLYNGIALLVTFFLCRIVWGSYQSVLIYADIYTALTSPTSNTPRVLDSGKCDGNTTGFLVGNCETGELPWWLVSIYLVGNTALSVLNFYWFSQMVKAVRKRFVPAKSAGAGEGTTKLNGHAKKAQ